MFFVYLSKLEKFKKRVIKYKDFGYFFKMYNFLKIFDDICIRCLNVIICGVKQFRFMVFLGNNQIGVFNFYWYFFCDINKF